MEFRLRADRRILLADSDLELVSSLDPRVVASNVLVEDVRGGSIAVNGAPNAPATAGALQTVIPELRRRGFRLVTLRRLLGR